MWTERSWRAFQERHVSNGFHRVQMTITRSIATEHFSI